MSSSLLYSLILALATACAAGVIGSFALMKRMSLAGDVMAHIALPGLGLALLWDIQPLIGGAATLLIGTLLIWQLEKRSSVTTDAAIGVIFTAAIAVGTLVTPSEELIEALFGGFGTLNLGGFVLGITAVILVISFLFKFRHQLILSLFSPELAESTGVNVHRVNLYYLLIFSVTIMLGLQFLGAILVGALIIIPAAIGRQLTHTLPAFLVTSAAASVVAVGTGFAVNYFHPSIALGPIIITIAAGLFVVSLVKKKK